MQIETTAMVALGAAVAAVSLALSALLLLLRAHVRSGADEAAVLRSLGATGRVSRGIRVLHVLPLALGSAATASAFALLLSDRLPIGVGRLLDLRPGRRANAPRLGAGIAVMAASMVAAVLPTSHRRARPISRMAPTTLRERLAS